MMDDIFGVISISIEISKKDDVDINNKIEANAQKLIAEKNINYY